MRSYDINDVMYLKNLMNEKAEIEKKNDPNYKVRYQQILKEIIELEKKMEIPFSKESFDEILYKKVIPISPGNLTEKQIEYLTKNYWLDVKYYQKLDEIEKIYNERKSITEFEKAANEYIKIWMQIKK
jgi:hypothetical protein